jgi:DNA-binding transcriptional MocR family regulator
VQHIAFDWADDMPHLFLPMPGNWRANDFAAAMRQAGALVRTMDHFSAGRAAPPQAVRISLNAAATVEQLHDGLQIVARVLEQGGRPD